VALIVDKALGETLADESVLGDCGAGKGSDCAGEVKTGLHDLDFLTQLWEKERKTPKRNRTRGNDQRGRVKIQKGSDAGASRLLNGQAYHKLKKMPKFQGQVGPQDSSQTAKGGNEATIARNWRKAGRQEAIPSSATD